MSDAQPPVFPGTYPGTIQAPPDIPGLIHGADLICQGEVTTVEDEGEVTYLVGGAPVPFRRRVASLALVRTFRGTARQDELPVEFLQPQVSSTLTVLMPGERVVLFLKRRGPRYALADLTTSKIDLEPPEPVVVEGAAESPREELQRLLGEARALSDAEVAAVAAALLDALP